MGHGPGGGSAHRLAFLPAQIDAGVHGRAVQEGVDPDPESRGHVDLAGDRLADRHGNERARERVDLGSGQLHAIELALEHARLGELRRHERAPHRRRFRLTAGVDAEVGEHPAHAPRLGIIAFLDGIEAGALARFDAIERNLQSRQGRFDPRGFRLGAEAACDGGRGQ